MNVFIGQDGANERMLGAGPTGTALGNDQGEWCLTPVSLERLLMQRWQNTDTIAIVKY
jgi:hypothetical protein